ncbi:T9SS type A sorting domain-containing protein [bacterium SCSIO 12741]|nr:T9SS type A sorting domain-containing protein [bacterium SCSIO 12741]
MTVNSLLTSISLALWLISVQVSAQDTLAFQGFEGTANDNWGITSGNNNSTATGSSDTPSNQRIKSGSASHLTNNATNTLILNGFSNSTHTSRYIEIWTSSTSGTSGNGADGADYIKVFVNNSNSFSATPDLQINGNSNVRYGMDGTGVMEITAGADSTYSYASGGTKTGANALTKIKINISDAWSEVHLKIETKNNSSSEFWNIDDIRLVGTHSCSSPGTAASSFSTSSISQSGMTVSWTRGNGDSVLVLGQALNAVTLDPVDGVHYSADSDFSGSGSSIGGSKVLYKGTGTSVAVTGLSSATTYHFGIYEYNGTGPCFTNNQLNGNETTSCSTPTNVSDLSQTDGYNQLTVNWTLPSCYDEVMLVCKEASTISGTPTGDGSSYTADVSFTGSGTAFDGGKVVYKGTGGSVTVTNLTGGTTYFFRMYSRKSTSWSSGYEESVALAYVPKLIITEVHDPSNLTTARFGELFNSDTTSIDFSFSTFYFCRQTNGGSFTCRQLTGNLEIGGTYVIANNSSTYNSTYGATADSTWGNTSGNGDDGYFLYYGGDNTSGTLVDAYGVLDEDGSGKSWEYTDSRAVRDTSIFSPNETWTASEWSIAGATTSDHSAGYHYGNNPSATFSSSSTIPAGHYGTLVLNGSGQTFTAGGNITVHGKLKLKNGVFNLNGNTLSLGNFVFDCAVSNASSTSYIYGGTVRTYVNNTTGTYQIELGTNGDGWTPSNITFSSATLAPTAYLDATVTASKHPNMDGGVTTFINRYWTIEPTGITNPNYSIELIYQDGDINGTEADLFPVKYGSTWERPANSTAAITDTMGTGSVNTGTNKLTWTGVRSFSIFGGAGNGTPLPVELTQFHAEALENGTQLQWETASEIHSSYFEIQHSANGISFEPIGQVAAAGYSNEIRQYRFWDEQLIEQSYYRLKTVDLDGSYEYSSVFPVIRDSQESNPGFVAYSSQNQVLVKLVRSTQGKVVLMNLDGQIVEECPTTEKDEIQFNSLLNPGVYIISLWNEQGNRLSTQKLEVH